MTNELTGGCQCGAVRFRVGRLGRGSICHCRMCQKAFGNFYAPLISAFEVTWTRGRPSYFQSSNKVRRGFCAACGTPLVYEVAGIHSETEVEMAIAAFDNPVLAAPTIQVNPRDKLPFVDALHAMPTRVDPAQDEFNAAIVSYQHPDHDTAEWPIRGGSHD
jgi:hypothetical protein